MKRKGINFQLKLEYIKSKLVRYPHTMLCRVLYELVPDMVIDSSWRDSFIHLHSQFHQVCSDEKLSNKHVTSQPFSALHWQRVNQHGSTLRSSDSKQKRTCFL